MQLNISIYRQFTVCLVWMLWTISIENLNVGHFQMLFKNPIARKFIVCSDKILGYQAYNIFVLWSATFKSNNISFWFLISVEFFLMNFHFRIHPLMFYCSARFDYFDENRLQGAPFALRCDYIFWSYHRYRCNPRYRLAKFHMNFNPCFSFPNFSKFCQRFAKFSLNEKRFDKPMDKQLPDSLNKALPGIIPEGVWHQQGYEPDTSAKFSWIDNCLMLTFWVNQGSNWRGVGGLTPQFSCSFHCDPQPP